MSEVSMFNALRFERKAEPEDEYTDLSKRVQSAKSLESLSIRAEFISTSKGDGDG